MVELQGSILFCDDVREEASGKSTLVGVYGGTYIVPRDEPAELAEVIGCFNGRIRHGRSVPLKITVEVLNHSKAAGPFVHEGEFADQSGTSYDEWTLRINMRIPILFEEGAIVKMTVEGANFKTDATMKMAYLPDSDTHSSQKSNARKKRAASKRTSAKRTAD